MSICCLCNAYRLWWRAPGIATSINKCSLPLWTEMVYSDYFIIVGPLPKYFDIFHFTHTVPQKHSSNSVRSCMPNANYGSLQARSQSFLAATNTPLFLISEIRFGSRLFPRIWCVLKMFGGATLSILDVPPHVSHERTRALPLRLHYLSCGTS